MCGRYASSRRRAELLEELQVVDDAVGDDLPADHSDYNIAPTKPVYAVLSRRPGEARDDAAPVRQLRVARWGLVPSWAKDRSIGARLINARVETVAEKPAFRRAFASRRCLLPADGYYEWYAAEGETASRAGAGTKQRKQPFFIRPRDGGVLAMAGLYELWRDPALEDDDPHAWLWSCAVVTTRAEDALGHIHDRMPMWIEPARWSMWLDPGLTSPEELKGLLTPAAPGHLEAYAVSTAVNNVRNNGPRLVEPWSGEDVAGERAPTLF